jgi:hypothetical protein
VKQSFIIYGNCQAEAIAAVLAKNALISSLFRIVYVRSFVHPTSGTMEVSDDDLAQCALLAEQHDPRPFPYRERLPQGSPIVTFPAVDSNMFWPFTVPNQLDAPEPPDYPFGRFPYGDRIIAGCIQKGMSAPDILDYYLNGWDDYKLDLDRLQKIEFARLRSRDDHCQVKMADYVIENLRAERLYWTVNHPTAELLREITHRLVRICTGNNETVENEADIAGTIRDHFGERGPLGVIGVPIHPKVAEHFGLTWYSARERWPYYGRMLKYEEYFRELIAVSLARKVAAS